MHKLSNHSSYTEYKHHQNYIHSRHIDPIMAELNAEVISEQWNLSSMFAEMIWFHLECYKVKTKSCHQINSEKNSGLISWESLYNHGEKWFSKCQQFTVSVVWSTCDFLFCLYYFTCDNTSLDEASWDLKLHFLTLKPNSTDK